MIISHEYVWNQKKNSNGIIRISISYKKISYDYFYFDKFYEI